MPQASGYAAQSAKAPLGPFSFQRRSPRENDVVIDIKFCGICHSDVHQARDEWGGSIFPMVPGHEIAGVVTPVAHKGTTYRGGDHVGVGCCVDSWRQCAECVKGDDNYCLVGMNATYNGREKDGTPTYGGYSDHIVVDENYVLSIPDNLPLDAAAPLLCAGITLYSPLKHWKAGPGKKVGIVGLGGLGHMGLKLAHAMGAEVTLFTTSPGKADDARRLGADHVVLSKDPDAMGAQAGRFDFVLDCVAAKHDIEAYLRLLKRDGTLVQVGAPPEPLSLNVLSLILARRNFAGSLIGGIAETQEMLDFCAEQDIVCDIELIQPDQINRAYERVIANDVKYRFVIDMNALAA